MHGVKYGKAIGVIINPKASTAAPATQVCTVVTTARSGALDLRYAPRDPKVSDKTTAY
jgi:hypothetical protein